MAKIRWVTHTSTEIPQGKEEEGGEEEGSKLGANISIERGVWPRDGRAQRGRVHPHWHQTDFRSHHRSTTAHFLSVGSLLTMADYRLLNYPTGPFFRVQGNNAHSTAILIFFLANRTQSSMIVLWRLDSALDPLSRSWFILANHGGFFFYFSNWLRKDQYWTMRCRISLLGRLLENCFLHCEDVMPRASAAILLPWGNLAGKLSMSAQRNKSNPQLFTKAIFGRLIAQVLKNQLGTWEFRLKYKLKIVSS